MRVGGGLTLCWVGSSAIAFSSIMTATCVLPSACGAEVGYAIAPVVDHVACAREKTSLRNSGIRAFRSALRNRDTASRGLDADLKGKRRRKANGMGCVVTVSNTAFASTAAPISVPEFRHPILNASSDESGAWKLARIMPLAEPMSLFASRSSSKEVVKLTS
jgi:hypothetical protein